MNDKYGKRIIPEIIYDSRNPIIIHVLELWI